MKTNQYSSFFPLQNTTTLGMGGTLKPVRKRRTSRLIYIVAAFLLFGIFLTFVNIYELKQMQLDHMGLHAVEAEGIPERFGKKQLTVWVHGKRIFSGYLNHVFAVFERIGYIRGDESSDWDVLWSHDYPFSTLKEALKDIKPHQKVNHFPGSGFITNKVNLATSKNIKHVPKAFKIPSEKTAFMDYAGQHPNTMWVQKSNNHRGVKILPQHELDLASEGTFIQQYVDDPLLIDGRRFDIGIYTTLTSVNPLRVYINEGDWLVRFCPTQYHPFDAEDRNKYVVSDDYLPLWNVPSLQKAYNEQGYTFRETLLSYLRMRGYDTDKMDRTLREAIRSVYLDKEAMLINALHKYKSQRSFFEMVRFDFVFDSKLNIYLMEVNMSPNLSSGHFPPNKLLYEQVIYSMLHLVGIARPTITGADHGTSDASNMQVSERDIHIHSDSCLSELCEENCKNVECKLCGGCLSESHKHILKSAYNEHNNRRQWRRILPRPFKDQTDAQNWNPKTDDFYSNLTTRNRWMALWFQGKCLQDSTWCQ